MPAEKPNRATVAMSLEDSAARILQSVTIDGDPVGQLTPRDGIAIAQAQATLALGQRLADLTDKLGEYLGDDSNLDRLQRALHDPQGRNVAEVLVDDLPGRAV